jgi:hypothetical protein
LWIPLGKSTLISIIAVFAEITSFVLFEESNTTEYELNPLAETTASK